MLRVLGILILDASILIILRRTDPYSGYIELVEVALQLHFAAAAA
jgi:hypothetical protein